MVMEDGHNGFLFSFFEYQSLVKFDPEIANLVKFTLEKFKKFKKKKILFQKMLNFHPQNKNTGFFKN
jgi:hypothetical protein